MYTKEKPTAQKTLAEWEADYPKSWIAEGPKAEDLDWVEAFANELAAERMTATEFRNVFNEAKRLQSMPYATAQKEFILLHAKMVYAKGRKMSDHNAEKNEQGIHKFIAVMLAAHRETLNGLTQARLNHFVDLMEAILAHFKVAEYTLKSQKTNKHESS